MDRATKGRDEAAMQAIEATVLGALDMAAEAYEVGHARRWLHELLAVDHASIADEVVLLGSELVTNSIRHSDSVELTVVVLAMGDAIRVEVADAGSAVNVPRMADSGLDAEMGRGLRMLDVLTHGRWGSFADDSGRTVWFEKAFPPSRNGGQDGGLAMPAAPRPEIAGS
jgi:anti-sigma regulatory factor (Ser/Thr protein kinase)